MSKCPLANLTDPELYQDGVPYELLSRFRERGSLVKMDDPLSGVPYWVAVKRDALDFVSKNPQIFSSSVKTPFPQEPKEEEREIAEMTTQLMAENSIINMDPPRHIKYRKVVSDAFTPRAVAEMEPILRQHAKEIVDRVASRGECEFVNEVAAELPLITILEMLGVPTDNRQRFLDLTNAMTFADDPDAATTPEEGQMAVMEVLTFAAEIAEQQKKNPTSTVAAALLEGEVDGKKVTSEMFAWMFRCYWSAVMRQPEPLSATVYAY